jgi:catechol-2,3-dioxygenase
VNFEKNPGIEEVRLMSTKIRHVAIHTDNHFRMANFYKKLFGMKKITAGMTDENGNYDKERGHLSDGVIGLALLQRQPGFPAGLDHFGLEVEDVQTIRDRLKQFYPEVFVAQSQGHVPFAGLRTHDPDNNQFDLSQKGMANVREGYLQEGWEQPRWINHIAIRSTRPAHLAEYYQKVFDLRPVEGLSGDGSYYVTDGKVTLALRPWDMMKYRGLMAGLDHFGFKVEDLAAAKKDIENLPNTAPGSAARKIAIGRDGETRQKNLEACKLCRHPLADPDGVLLDLTD